MISKMKNFIKKKNKINLKKKIPKNMLKKK